MTDAATRARERAAQLDPTEDTYARAATCRAEGHLWAMIRLGPQGRRVYGLEAVLMTCSRCRVADVRVDERRMPPAPGTPLTMGMHGPRHAISEWRGSGADLTCWGTWRTVCGIKVDARQPGVDILQAGAPTECGNCARRDPQWMASAVAAAPALYAALVERADAHDPGGVLDPEALGPPFHPERMAWLEAIGAQGRASANVAPWDLDL